MRTIFLLILLIYSSHCKEYRFPDNFKFGVATAAYQVEGAWNTSGKGENNWDRLTHSDPELIADRGNGDVACDTYSKTKEDVQLLKYLGIHFYRFSIAWSRILPNGKIDYINPDGVRYYNELIDELLANDIEPMVTMHHFDLPQALEDEGGFMNLAIADYFEEYAKVLYENFGDRVKTWITFNEPIVTCYFGYSSDLFAPRANQLGIAGYLCGHTLLIAHAKAYHLYNKDYEKAQGGRVGITNIDFWFEPLHETAEDIKAAEVAHEYFLGWFTHPIFSENGDYPPIIKEKIAQLSKQQDRPNLRLPELTSKEIESLKGSADFFGLNHYTTLYCTETSDLSSDELFFFPDIGINCLVDNARESAASSWLKVIPWAFRRVLNWIKDKYNNPEIIITENGYSDSGNILRDCRRINYYNSYLTELLKAIHEDDCNISGYTAWSFLDNFEWRSGYTERFGVYSVDFDDPNRPRTPKMSAHVFKNIIHTKNIDWNYTPSGFAGCDWSKSINNLSRDEL